MNNNKNYYSHHNHHHNVDRSRNQETRCAHTFHHNHNHVCEPLPCRPRFHGAPHGFGPGLHVNAPCGHAGFGMHRPAGHAGFHGAPRGFCGRPAFGRPDFNRPGCGRPMNHRPGEFKPCGHPYGRPGINRPGCGRPMHNRPAFGRPGFDCKPYRGPFHPTGFRKADGSLIIETKLAGFAPEDLKTVVENDRLTVTATRRTASGEETYSCRYPLRGIDKDSVTASLKDGLLTLVLPFLKDNGKTEEKPADASGNAQSAAE